MLNETIIVKMDALYNFKTLLIVQNFYNNFSSKLK